MEQMARYSISMNFYIAIGTANKMKNRNAVICNFINIL